MKTKLIITALAAVLALTIVRAADITPAEARAIAKEAYIYGFPMVDSYRIQHTYFVDRENPEYKGPWNQIVNTPRVYTPEDKAIQTPNSDTPYSIARPGPARRTDRAHRAADRKGALFQRPAHRRLHATTSPTSAAAPPATMAAATSSPDRTGRARLPKGVKKVIRSETEFVFAALSHAALQPGRPRQCEEGAGRLQGAAAVGVPRHSPHPRPRRRLISSSRSRLQKRRRRRSSSTS